MKYKHKKALIIGLSVLVPIAIVGTVAGVYFGTSSVQRISQKGIFTFRVNENLNNDGYKFDLSANYGSPTSGNRPATLLNNELIHTKTSGKLEVTANTKEGIKVVSPSYESYKFANARAIVLTFFRADITQEELNNKSNLIDGSDYFQLVFDNDDDELINESSDSSNQNQNDFIVTRKSKNPRSINNYDVFWKILENRYLDQKIDLSQNNVDVSAMSKKFVLANMGLTFDSVDENGNIIKNYWVDSKGNATKYEIKAMDMLYSAKRTWLYDRAYRRSHGGSSELDNYFIKKTQTIIRFGETMKYPNEYLFDFFGVDKVKLYEQDEAIQKVMVNNKSLDMYTMWFDIFNKDGNMKDEISFSANDVFKKYLTSSIHFSLAPSDYIKNMLNDNPSINNTSSGQIKGEAAEYAIYTYAQTREKTLYACQYIPVSSVSGREIYEYNKHYADQDWVKSVEELDDDGYRTLNKIIIEYAGSIDSSTFINQSFNSFQNGTLSQVDYSLLSDSQKQKLYGYSENVDELIKNSQYNGLQATKKINLSQMTSRMVWQANPNADSSYTFNDNYSKLVYGMDSKKLSEGNNSTANSFYAGYGFKFRTLIQSSINWNQYINQAYTGTRDVWLSGAAQNAKFSSWSDDSLTPVDFNLNGMNDLFYIDENDEVKTYTLQEMKKLTNMSLNELKEEELLVMNGSEPDLQTSKLRSYHFKEIQKSIKKLLDDFYIENNWAYINEENKFVIKNEYLDQKIEWDIAYPFADQDEIKCAATESIVKIINSLDSRLNAKFIKPTSREEMLGQINQRRGAFNANLWSYDYEGIGSYISGYTSDGGGINIVNAYGIFSKDINNDDDSLFDVSKGRISKDIIQKLQKAFPKFTELSKFVRQEMNKYLGNQASNELKVENWDLISNYWNNHLTSYFTNTTITEVDRNHNKNEIFSNPNNIDPISVLPSIHKLFEREASWENESNTKEEKGQSWVKLIMELNSIKGVSIDTESSVDLLESVNYALYLREYIVPISKQGYMKYPDIKYKSEK